VGRFDAPLWLERGACVLLKLDSTPSCHLAFPRFLALTAGPFLTNDYGDEPSWGGMGGGDPEPASEGSFRFFVDNAGIYRTRIANPSLSEPRTVTFAWLKGASDFLPLLALKQHNYPSSLRGP
jgi:hypothetical protein